MKLISSYIKLQYQLLRRALLKKKYDSNNYTKLTFLRIIIKLSQDTSWEESVQFSLSVVSDSANPWTASCQASLSIINSQSLYKLMSIELVMPSNHIIFCHPLLLLPSIFPRISVFLMSQLFASGGQSIGASAFSISPSNDYSGLISFRIDWFDLLAVQETLRSLWHSSTKASILWCSAFFMVQLSYPFMTTGKTITLTRLDYSLGKNRNY